MSVRNAGIFIKEARLKAGFSLEKLSDGICSIASLSRIEHNEHGVSPSTFQALMSRLGYPCEIFPLFENWTDYECSFALIHARFHIDAWQLGPAYEELKKIENKHWNNNKFHYQAWLMLYSILQLRSGTADHIHIKEQLLNALHISQPSIHIKNLQRTLLSLNEIEILIYLAQEMLFTEQPDTCSQICLQLFEYLNQSNFSFTEKDKLLAECAIVYAKYLISQQNYIQARQLAEQHRHHMVELMCDAPLLELTFLVGLSDYMLGNISDATNHFKDVLYASHAIKSPYMTICKNYLTSQHIMVLPKHLKKAEDISLKKYPQPALIDYTCFSNGIFDIYETDVITLGRLIHELRLRQKISQKNLCQGLCSTSMLSKIENNKINPDIILTESLLQRLGLSDREFIFLGNNKETKLHELRFKLRKRAFEPRNEDFKILEQYKESLPPNNILYKQIYLYETSYFIKDSNKRIQHLLKALHLTLKDFNIALITNYRLTWMELTLLNAIADEFLFSDTPYVCLQYLYQILNYYEQTCVDQILQSQTLVVTLKILFRYLYNHHQNLESVNYYITHDLTIMRYFLSKYSIVLFYYCQSLGECKQYEQSLITACYACIIENIYECFDNTSTLKEGFINDFNLDIPY